MACGADGGGDRAARMVADFREERSVRVEIARLGKPLHVGRAVDREQRGVVAVGCLGLPPRPVRMGPAKVRGRPEDAGRLLRPHRRAVA